MARMLALLLLAVTPAFAVGAGVQAPFDPEVASFDTSVIGFVGISSTMSNAALDTIPVQQQQRLLSIRSAAARDTIPVQQQQRPLSIRVDRENALRPIVRVGPVLGDRELERAATSGLPLRVRVRVELWRDRLFDELVEETSWSTVIVHEPIAEQYFIRSLPAEGGVRRASTFAEARAMVESEYLLSMRPRREGRYYYTVSLQIETLSVSDLEELERWLQGELQPAVSGERSVTGAVGQGAKRLMLRILDLPERRYDARTERFRAG